MRKSSAVNSFEEHPFSRSRWMNFASRLGNGFFVLSPRAPGFSHVQPMALLIALLGVTIISGMAQNPPPADTPSPAPSTNNAPVPAPLSFGQPVTIDWRWVQGAVFVPTNATNEAQQWDQYDPVINDRELHYAAFYGMNSVCIYLNYYVYLKKKDALLSELEDFLTRADKYGLKTAVIFFDDCHVTPPAGILSSDYQYPPPIYGVHNSRWVQCPGPDIKKKLAENEAKLKAYVQDVVTAHKSDPRIMFWETYNEPNKSQETRKILQDSIGWVHETGTTIPVTATGGGFPGGPYSDFISWHKYHNYSFPKQVDPLPDSLCTECMNRQGQTVPGIIEHFKGKAGYMFWELGIGRDNCRFSWKDNPKTPSTDEPTTPFHGIIYPDGHPWALDDVKALMGADAFAKAPVFNVTYYKDDHFSTLAKTSITPMIDFDLDDEVGTGSPDASAGVPKEHFSVVWTGTILPPATGSFTIYADCDDAVAVSVNSQPIFHKTTPGRSEVSAAVSLTANTPVPIKIEYVHGTGRPSLHLSWSGPQMTKCILLPSKS